MRKLNSFLLLLFAAMMASPGVKAQTDAEYDAAMAAINDGGIYRIKTNASGTEYYVTLTGGLTSVKDNAGFFTLTKSSGGALKADGIRIDTGSERFTNPPLANNVANLTPGNFAHSTNDRGDWERQVFFLNEDGKYAIRSCNTQPATSSWGDAGRTFWTYNVAEVATPAYSYDPAYVWELDGPLTPVNVTYKLVDPNNTEVSKIVVKQEANSSVNVPASLVSNFLYEYSVEGTIGDTDSEITVTRTMKNGIVHSFEDLSNQKAYIIGCERGMFLTKNDYLATNYHNSLKDAEPTDFAVISYEDQYYLYSVTDKKFVTNNGSLSEMPVNGVYDAIRMTPKADPLFLYCFQINETTQYGLNINGNDPYGYVINTWVTADAGNQYYMIANADFDPADALAALNDFFHPSYFVTYIVKDEAGNEIFKSEPVPTRQGAKITTLPAIYQRPFTKYTEVDVTIAEEQTSVEFTAIWDGPFQLSTSEDDAKWYNMTIRSNYHVFVDAEEPYYPKQSGGFQLMDETYQWAFAGNAYTGIMVFNKSKGFASTLTKDGDMAVMRDGQYAWEIGANSNGFTLKEADTEYNCINQSGGATGPLKFWNSANSRTDDGSTFRISEAPTSFEWTIGEAGYATMYLPVGVDLIAEAPATVPEAIGTWTFDNANDLMAGKGVATLEANGDGIRAVEGPTATNGAVQIDKGSFLKMNSNINATSLNTYSILFDISAADLSGYSVLFTNDLTNKKDGSFFIKNGQLGLNSNGLGYNGQLIANQWHRVLFVAEKCVVTIYLDGEKIRQSASAGEEHWLLSGEGLLFFADNDGEEKTINAAELRFWDKALTAEQAALLGTPNGQEAAEDGVMAYAGKINENSLSLVEIGTTIPAYTPVVLKGAPKTYVFYVNDNVQDLGIQNDLMGTLVDVEAAGKYVLAKPEGKEVGFYKAETGTLKANKAYIEVPESAGVKAFFFNDAETAIESLTPTFSEGEGAIYNLSGQRVNKAQKGIYIINGKKVLK